VGNEKIDSIKIYAYLSLSLITLQLTGVFVYAPDLAFTLISVTQLDTAKCSVLFKSSVCTIMYPDVKTMDTVPLVANGLD
jgi:hypothetical protein